MDSIAKIHKIDYIELKRDKLGKTYYLTHATLNDGTEASGYGKEYSIGDNVAAWFDDQHNKIKMRKAKAFESYRSS